MSSQPRLAKGSLPLPNSGGGVEAMHEPKHRQVRGTTPELQRAAFEMRREMTSAEQLLWQALRKRQVNGMRFRAQHPVGRFVLDFFCPAHRLVIEVDGPIHDRQHEEDAARTALLEAHGYRVLRFGNDEILTDLPSVLQRIVAVVPPPPELGAGVRGLGAALQSIPT